METRIVPPPFPKQHKKYSLGSKILILGLQSVILMIGALTIWIMVESRDISNKRVADEITQSWGNGVHINGPIIVSDLDSLNTFVGPVEFKCEATIKSKSLHRNIYEAEVFNAEVALSGCFSKQSISDILGDTVYIKLGELSPYLISNETELFINGQKVDWNWLNNFMYAKINISELQDSIEFSTSLSIRGSSSISIDEVGAISSITINGVAKNPSFYGSSLPDERTVNKHNFYAHWTRSLPYSEINQSDPTYVRASFLVGVDKYQKVSRTLKYAFIIIVLTYTSVLFSEIIMKRYIPVLNYFLIGIALIVFYSLLLAFTEHIAFGGAYIIAASMTVLLIAGYMWRILNSRKGGTTIGIILSCIYTICYVMLIASTYALLLGSLILFFALAGMMYGSLHANRE